MAYGRKKFTPQELSLIEQRYGSTRGFVYPHHLSQYEDKLQSGAAQLPLESRLTCSSCKAMADTDHIVAHASDPTTPSIQKMRAAKNKTKNVTSDAQFTLNFD